MSKLNEDQMSKFLNRLNSYCLENFRSKADINDYSNIGLVYTTLTDKEVPIQVSVDINDMKLKTWIGDEFCSEESLVKVEEISYDELMDLLINDNVYSYANSFQTYIEDNSERW